MTETNILPIIGYKLNSQNYIQWARSVCIFLQGKGKEDYITDNAKEPEKEDPTHQKWKLENSLVMSWLPSSMTHETAENFMYYGTAVEIWNAAKETYSNVDNTSTIFEIKSLLHDLRQEDSSVTEYYHSLTRYWQQLDIYEDIDWKCTEDRKQYKTPVEKDRIYQFLLGLNKNLDEVKGRILDTKPLPSICDAFAEVRREESRRKIMLGRQINSVNTESSALAARGPQKKNKGWCDHCRKTGHTRETCWLLQGKPADWKPRHKENRAHTAIGGESIPISESEPSPFNKEQMEMIQTILRQNSPKHEY
ncbi:Retrotransposon gag domain [Sesbania bispinosa]|nr:Retrotransposon gag domain [Sesbania bispinosa]